MEIKSYVYSLRTDKNSWLAEIVITDDGMISGVTDWGNFAYAWRAFGDNFKIFLSDIDTSYFADKIISTLPYGVKITKKIKERLYMLAEHILPVLQKVIKEELNSK